MKFSTATTDAFGSTIRKYATAFTRTGTLSLVMTSCGGMLSVIVRRSTLTIRSTIGIRMKRPGPFGSGSNRPRRKTIPRSYSRATLIAEMRNSTRMSATATSAMTAAVTGRSLLDLLDRQLEPVHALDLHVLARDELGAVGPVRAPELAG